MPRAGDVVQAFLKSRWFYWGVFTACALPLVLLLKDAIPVLVPAFWPDVTVPWSGDLGVNPTETLLHATGRHTLRFLLLALAITPIRRLTGWNRVQRVRRMIGLWSFVYALCHFTTYVALDQLGDVRAIADDVLKRKFIFSGMLAFVILLALAATSTNGMIRRLGRRWQQLHRLVYVAAVAGAVHFVWGQKADIREPLLWAGILAVLLGARVVLAVRKRRVAFSPAVSR
ncbi:MAG TPA: protein-methionine-sulfoxide reductase heme-binding subunit MsrQ [Vicinamibacterales bacterium]|nr:protein-methionine-sulfoxide reductase heme-binding subunit MsrQ [Vicinamibacterales bacterium]